VVTDREQKTHEHQAMESFQLVGALRNGTVSRRDFMRRASTLGFSAAVIDVFLIACGGSASPTVTPAAVTTAATTTATKVPTTGAAVSTTAASTNAPGATTAGGSTSATSASGSAAAGSPATGAAPAGIATAQGTLLGGEVPKDAKLAAKQELRYPYNEIVNPDPGKSTAILEVQYILQCWDGLVSSNQLGDPKPAHADKWVISPDGITYTFTLKKGLKFSDGSPLTAKDYEWTWKRNLDPALASEYATALYVIKGAEDYNSGKAKDSAGVQVMAVDDTTLKVTLEQAAPYFLALVSTWTYVPLQRATIEKNKEKWTEAGNLVSAGPFKLKSWDHDQSMVLVPDDNYYGDKPSLSQITLVIYKDIAASGLPAYENGELDIASPSSLSPTDLDRIRNDSKLKDQLNLISVSYSGMLVFDTTNTKSLVSNKIFRQAVYTAINRDRLATDILKGQYLPNTTFAPKGILGHIDKGVLPGDLIKGDKAAAKQLFQQAGYTGQEIVYTHSDQTLSKTIAQFIQSDLKEAGVNIRLDILERKAYSAWRTARKDQPFEIYQGGWFSDYEDPNNWYNFFWTQSAAANFWHDHWQNPEFLKLIGDGDKEGDRAKREQLYIQAEKVLLTEVPIAPIITQLDAVMVKPYVKGLVHTNLAQDIFKGVKILQH